MTTCDPLDEFEPSPDFDTGISIYTGSCEGGTFCFNNDDSPLTATTCSTLVVNSELGTEYYIHVYGSKGGSGPFLLMVYFAELEGEEDAPDSSPSSVSPGSSPMESKPYVSVFVSMGKQIRM